MSIEWLPDPARLDATWLANQVFVRGTLIVLAAIVASRVLRSASAASRYGIWVLAVCFLVVSPVLSFPHFASDATASKLGLAERLPSRALTSNRAAYATNSSEAWPTEVAAPRDGQNTLAPAPSIARASRLPSPPDWWVWVWAICAVASVIRLGRDMRAAAGLRERSFPADPGVRSGCEAIRRRVCPNRVVHVRTSPDVQVPVVVGGRTPVIIVPPDAGVWPAERLRSALRHELAHVARGDPGVHVVTRAVLALYWLNPLTWIVGRNLDREREHACDDRVLEWGTPAPDYALHLVEVARAAGGRPWRAASAFARKPFLRQRVESILQPVSRRPWGRPAWLLAVAIAASMTLAFSSLELFQTRHDARRGEAIAGLGHPDASMRRHAAWMLGELESQADVRIIETHLQDPSADVRMTAAWALGEIKNPASIPALSRTAAQDADPIVREIAVLSIGEIENTSGVAPIIAAVAADPALRRAAAWALSEIEGPTLARSHGLLEPGAQPLAREVWAGDWSAPVSPVPDDVSELIEALSAGRADLRRDAALQLGRAGVEIAVDPLLDSLHDPQPEVRAAAVWALDEINPSR